MARKPIPGGDSGAWGNVLNEFLDVAHNSDGSLKNGTVNASTLNTSSGPGTGQVLAWNGSGLAWVPESSLLSATVVLSSYTLALTDQGKVIEANSITPMTITVPPNSSVAFPVGAVLEVYQYGLGEVVIAPGAGVTLRAAGDRTTLSGQYSSAALRKRATDEWTLVGDLVD